MENTAQPDLFDLQDRPGKGGTNALDGNPRETGKAGKPSPDEFSDYLEARKCSSRRNRARIEKLSQPFIGPVAGNGVNSAAQETAGVKGQEAPGNRSCCAPICNLASTCPDAGEVASGGGEERHRWLIDRVGGGNATEWDANFPFQTLLTRRAIGPMLLGIGTRRNTMTNATAAIEMTFAKLPIVPVWTVGRSDFFAALASIRQAKDGAFDVHAEKVAVEKFPEAADFAMTGFRTLEAAKGWCEEVFADLYA